MPRVLLIDDDPGTLQGWTGILKYSGFDVLTAACGNDGLALATRTRPDVILVDLRLPDISGLEVVRELQQRQLTIPIIVVTGFGDVQSAVDAIKLGAVDYVEKPLIGEDILRAVERGLAHHSPGTPEAHAASRWARAVRRIVDAPHDPKTIGGWSRVVGVSVGALKNWCRTAGLSPKQSLDLGRLLRAVVRFQTDGLRPEDSLDVVDRRTLKRLLSLGGDTEDASRLPERVDDLLDTQGLIRSATALSELKRTMRSRY